MKNLRPYFLHTYTSMKKFISSIGPSKSILIALPCALFLVVIASAFARFAMASTASSQQKAAEDIGVQHGIIEKNQPMYDAFIKAQEQLHQDELCMTDSSQCSFISGTSPAK